MAGDWIKVETVLPDKPEVFAIAHQLDLPRDAVVGKLLRMWIWADQHTQDGHAPSVTLSVLDALVNVTGFAQAVRAAGWLEVESFPDDFSEEEIVVGVVFPNFDRHNGNSAKRRALATRRKQAEREKNMSRTERDKNVTREEKRRNERTNVGDDERTNEGGLKLGTKQLQVIRDDANRLSDLVDPKSRRSGPLRPQDRMLCLQAVLAGYEVPGINAMQLGEHIAERRGKSNEIKKPWAYLRKEIIRRCKLAGEEWVDVVTTLEIPPELQAKE